MGLWKLVLMSELFGMNKRSATNIVQENKYLNSLFISVLCQD